MNYGLVSRIANQLRKRIKNEYDSSELSKPIRFNMLVYSDDGGSYKIPSIRFYGIVKEGIEIDLYVHNKLKEDSSNIDSENDLSIYIMLDGPTFNDIVTYDISDPNLISNIYSFINNRIENGGN